MANQKQVKVEKEIKSKIASYFDRLADKYGKHFLALEGIVLVDNKIIKISNLGGFQ